MVCEATLRNSKKIVNKYGSYPVLIITPWIGIWVMIITMKAFKMDSNKILIYSFISITVYSVAIAVLMAMGKNFIS